MPGTITVRTYRFKDNSCCRSSAGEAGTSKTEADAKEAEKVKEAKRKGRFQIVESEDKSQQKPKQVDSAHPPGNAVTTSMV